MHTNCRGTIQARFNYTQIAKTAEQLGATIIRWGLVLTLIGAGGMKFTAYEAMSIQSLVVHSPIVSWIYECLSVRFFSIILGFVEIGTGVLIAFQSISPKVSAGGSILAMVVFATTLLIWSTQAWDIDPSFQALSAMHRQSLLKDIVLFGASLWSLGMSLKLSVSNALDEIYIESIESGTHFSAPAPRY